MIFLLLFHRFDFSDWPPPEEQLSSNRSSKWVPLQPFLCRFQGLCCQAPIGQKVQERLKIPIVTFPPLFSVAAQDS
jgi:hypothetical protein